MDDFLDSDCNVCNHTPCEITFVFLNIFHLKLAICNKTECESKNEKMENHTVLLTY